MRTEDDGRLQHRSTSEAHPEEDAFDQPNSAMRGNRVSLVGALAAEDPDVEEKHG